MRGGIPQSCERPEFPLAPPFLATAGIAFGLHKFYYVNYNLFKDL